MDSVSEKYVNGSEYIMKEEYLKLNDGSRMPRLGMGTWYLGENKAARKQEIEALRAGIHDGCSLIDTAEMYGSGKSEQLIGEAIKGIDRSSLFIVSKVYPHNAGRAHIFDALDRSLRNLRTDYLDLYLLHWRGQVPLRETVECMEQLVKEGKIRRWGVSNFDTDDMEELFSVKNGDHCAVNQVLYHLGSRGVEYDLMPWLEEHHVPLMAYCPLAQGGDLRRGLLNNKAVQMVAEQRHITAMQVLLAFVLHHENVIAIPRSGKAEHVLENCQAAEIKLTEEEYRLLDRAFPAPDHKVWLDIV